MNVDSKYDIDLVPVAKVGSHRTAFGELLRCPRCCRNTLPLDYPGPLSRTDNVTEICGGCGTVEALADFYARGHSRLDPDLDWPVRLPTDPRYEAKVRIWKDD